MPITFVDRQLIDIGHAVNPVLAQAASSCYQSTVDSGSSSWQFIVSEFIMANMWRNVVNAFDRLIEQ